MYPQKQEVRRAQSRPPDATIGGPLPSGPLSQARAPGGPCPASSSTFPLEEDARPYRGGSRKVSKTSQISEVAQDQYLGTYPKIFQSSGREFRSHFVCGRDQILVRLKLGLRKHPQASRSLLGARIRESACPHRLCQAPPGGPDRVLLTPRPLQRTRFVCGPRAPWPLAQGGCHTLPPEERVSWLLATRPRLMPGTVSPLTGGLPHKLIREPKQLGVVPCLDDDLERVPRLLGASTDVTVIRRTGLTDIRMVG